MAGRRGNIKLAIMITGLALLCVIAYYVLLYLVTPHPPHVDYPVPGDLPPNAEVYDGGYIVYHNASNYTAVSDGIVAESAYNVSTGPGQSADYEPVSFFELPLWI